MELLLALLVVAALTFALRKPLKSAPWVFYLIAIAANIAFLSNVLVDSFLPMGRVLFPYMQRCLISFALLCVVMAIGVLPENSGVRKMLNPIRGELSILAALFALGHITSYAARYISQPLDGLAVMPANISLSLIIAVVLVVLLTLLTITSFNFAKQRMDSAAWKKLQKLAYPFFVLTYAHLALILFPAISRADQKAVLSLAVYTVIMVAYVVLRLAKARTDKKSAIESREKAAALFA